MNSFVIYLSLLAIIIGSSLASDYCSSKICYSGYKHIACGHSGKFASTCPEDAAMVNFNSTLKNLLVAGHNKIRNSVAGGSVANHTAACRMATMQWDDELASLAAYNVRQCAMKHDQCHNTDDFQYSGQNLAWFTYNGEPNYESLSEKSLKMWNDEAKYSDMSIIKSFPTSYKGPVIGHFTVMVVDRNIRVGCAASIYSVKGKSHKIFLLACNYASSSMGGFPVYDACSTPGSSCTTGKNSQYPNLCSASEVYAVNKWY